MGTQMSERISQQVCSCDYVKGTKLRKNSWAMGFALSRIGHYIAKTSPSPTSNRRYTTIDVSMQIIRNILKWSLGTGEKKI
jgi:hypothetical protein